MGARVLAVVLLGLFAGCTDSEFLRGTRCGSDRDCGRSLSCEHRVCGGCPPQIPLDGARCACPGDRVLDCRLLVDPHCMPVCRSADDLCKVVEVTSDGTTREVPECSAPDDSDRPCFWVRFDGVPPECNEGEAWIELDPPNPAAELVVNCPPPESEESDFDCEPP